MSYTVAPPPSLKHMIFQVVQQVCIVICVGNSESLA